MSSIKKNIPVLLILVLGLNCNVGFKHDTNKVTGELKKWYPVTISFHGPFHKESQNNPNPFLDYRLQVIFRSPEGKLYDVPGFFDGNGDGINQGKIWKVRFSPDEVGEWNYKASFRKGPDVAVKLENDAGEACFFNGASGSFFIKEIDELAPGFLKWGRLEYVGSHYLKFRDGPYWVKGGADSPEDFLAYKGFVNTPRATHSYIDHVKDWEKGDPDWNDGAGKGIIGALNYLASQYVNSIYFLTMNIGGDGKNVWPFSGTVNEKGDVDNDNLHFDICKLNQWNEVFRHAQNKGIALHFVLNEAEEANKLELDSTALGVERKLYYRELIALFAHHLALQWNLCEEYNLKIKLSPELIKSYAQYIKDIDPYDHPVTVHHSGNVMKAWRPFLNDNKFPVTSFQWEYTDFVETWRHKSDSAGFPQVVHIDELFPDKSNASNADRHRREYIWPIYLSGGGMELILEDLIKTDNFRDYEILWKYVWYARKFMQENLPFHEMNPMDNLLSLESTFQGKNNVVEGQVFAQKNEYYAIYLPNAIRTGSLDLSGTSGNFLKSWYNPRTGEFKDAEKEFTGGRIVELGAPPAEASEDWVVLIKRMPKD